MLDFTDSFKQLHTFKGMHVPKDIPQGDMPSDPIEITQPIIEKANRLFPTFVEALEKLLTKQDKVVISIAGGSGVGKTSIASLFTYYLNQYGIGCYTLSGDNYPRRIPEYNDAERLHLYREYGIKGLVKEGYYNDEVKEQLKALQLEDKDSDPSMFIHYPWLACYKQYGEEGLKEYLGTGNEIRFEQVDEVLKAFKEGQQHIYLKRMGRDETSLYYDLKDFSQIQVILLEWTHGLSSELQQIDLRILLNSTPEETMAFRIARGRDANVTSPFVNMVLAIEQKKLHHQAENADIIVDMDGEVISKETYHLKMKELDD